MLSINGGLGLNYSLIRVNKKERKLTSRPAIGEQILSFRHLFHAFLPDKNMSVVRIFKILSRMNLKKRFRDRSLYYNCQDLHIIKRVFTPVCCV